MEELEFNDRILRKDFGKIPIVMGIPSLIEVQQRSFEDFLQMDMLPENREEVGLQAVFREIFPIKDYTEKISLEFISYELGQWECKCGKLKGMQERYTIVCSKCSHSKISELSGTKCPECSGRVFYKRCQECNSRVSLKLKYSVSECLERGKTFAVPLKVKVQLIMWEDTEEGEKNIREIKEQEVYLGEFPLMTEVIDDENEKISVGCNGTFIINGTERVIVSQMHRSPGVFFTHDRGKGHSSGKLLYSCRVIPYRGSWLDFEFDYKDILYVKIDKRRKIPITVFLKALGFSTEDILRQFYKTDKIKLNHKEKTLSKILQKTVIGQKAPVDLKDPKTGELILKENRKITLKAFQSLKASGVENIPVNMDELSEMILASDVVDSKTGEVLGECGERLTDEFIDKILQTNITKVDILAGDEEYFDLCISKTLEIDKCNSQQNALEEIYRRIRPGDPPTKETASSLFNALLFDPKRYDLSRVGRLKLNEKLALEHSLDLKVLTKEDIIQTIGCLIKLKNGIGEIDDIDHLGNRRVRTVGELLENQFRIGLVRLERAIKERMRMNIQDSETLMPTDLINSKPVTAVIKEFFGSSQLSQFMDQTNPLSELTHKRRLSALGPGGLTRERAGFEVRDVQPSHYGRICPIETPEGPNIGLIASLSTYARVNEFGFIETPYRRVVNGRVSSAVEFLSANKEDKFNIAQANAPVDKSGKLMSDRISARRGGDFVILPPERVDYIDVSPKQLVSVATALIPFLEHDDANRALMGSNMQRQSVPLLCPQAPLVGTGMESIVARECGCVVVARRSGIVENVSAARIVIMAGGENDDGAGESTNVDIYTLKKFQRSNQNTCINQRPLVKKGENIVKGQVIADGPSTDKGDLALGRNVLVAFMPWEGYNFEDSIVVSEKLVKNDSYTSLHIERYDVEARDTKFGPEEITRDIPNIGEGALKNLDESGIVYIGAKIKAGDIMVGKITPKGESQLSPEEKLLRAIFGEKARDVRDTSLKMPPGAEGVVIDVKVFSRKGVDKDERSKTIEDEEIGKAEKNFDDEIRIIMEERNKKIYRILLNAVTKEKYYHHETGKSILPKNTKITAAKLKAISPEEYGKIQIKDSELQDRIENLIDKAEDQIHILETIRGKRIARLQKGDELAPGVIKLVKVYVATERKLAVGDKIAGRHGNKGVVSKIVPEEDMPFLPDGTPIEMILNPLGVPSRMNVGQILETHLGWAAMELGKKVKELIDRTSISSVKKDIEECIGWELDEDLKAGKTDLVLCKKGEVVNKDIIAQANSLGVKEALVRDYPSLRAKIKDIYNNPKISKHIDSLSSGDLKDMVKELKNGIYMSTPVFDGASIDDIKKLLEEANLPKSGKIVLFDGKTGESFDQEVTVGYIYISKLHHLVDDKLHARSIGPYSLVTQQPLGGKSQFGGQRLGEMEVWALEAYGAAYTLQEMLTVKSDDLSGRTAMYESIVKGENPPEPGLPESFNVLLKELQSLALDVELVQRD
ncbi:MAG: DNA-directed RNA polymerase subunit beta [Candidatus Schekmanbacteria bacterium RIFCSPHIGHO2_02_FULL_38_11]|uniref:DNA-directed RNA polymerase subunit beta n=1 Tax=Candidatus Schekmanbacteria bacterium RIFCSPLOWO2_12_FULL_38_15 TaxID=1817883 RepID=A0A1F7SCU3_9BACT|nr:MAG: DNA-directed RNA polymerase subunit beta [Candidatus Schekmanbacteria bacterium RIFCSPLOWO2_02_FULL_38_14]OGL51613.1 MAG: DNA-directed RNA polymerase subunit beta [Candidatus Schekmanbacteria bacterium RIFCSPLOWO2_12_FULL_38_15]OGL55179.1 MAG: DNA-directed RNA polymerase subunit beta [Candidatus Schekmanbacteria bacterium RIFCSPHIGHO2_02_FULL_38_11]